MVNWTDLFKLLFCLIVFVVSFAMSVFYTLEELYWASGGMWILSILCFLVIIEFKIDISDSKKKVKVKK